MSVTPMFFPTAAQFRQWLHQHHASSQELWVGFHKKGSGLPSITWPESVEEALCFGWIDGVRRSIDDRSYAIRFTPRKAASTWSAVNIAKVKALVKAGRMQPAGLRAFETRDPRKAQRYSFEQRERPALTAEELRRFRASKEAWRFFQSQPRGYRKVSTFWVISAKREDTRARRLGTLITDSAAGQRIAQLRRNKP